MLIEQMLLYNSVGEIVRERDRGQYTRRCSSHYSLFPGYFVFIEVRSLKLGTTNRKCPLLKEQPSGVLSLNTPPCLGRVAFRECQCVGSVCNKLIVEKKNTIKGSSSNS